MKFVLKFSFVLSAAMVGTIQLLSSPCASANMIVEKEASELVLRPGQPSKLTNLRGVSRAAAHATTMTTEVNMIHDNQVERKLDTKDLQNGVPLTGLSGDIHTSSYFALRNVSAGSIVTCTTSGGTGNVDLVMELCESWQLGTDESCAVGPIVNATDVLIKLVAFFDSYTNVMLTCSTSRPIPILYSGVPMKNLSGAQYSNSYFVLRDAPVGKRVFCNVIRGYHPSELYVKMGSVSNITSDYDCYKIYGNDGPCWLGPMEASTDVYLNLYGYTVYSGATLTCYIVQYLWNAAPRTGLSGDARSNKYFALRNVPGGKRVTCTTSGGTGDVDLYVKKGGFDQIREHPDCSSTRVLSNSGSCSVNTATSTDVFVDLFGRNLYRGVTLICSF